MEKTENMTTVRAEEVSSEEIAQVRSAVYDLMGVKIAEDSPLVEALLFILDTLASGQDITLIAGPTPEEYVLAH